MQVDRDCAEMKMKGKMENKLEWVYAYPDRKLIFIFQVSIFHSWVLKGLKGL